MSRHIKRREAEKLGKTIAAALVDGSVITPEQGKNIMITVGGHKKKLRTVPRQSKGNKRWKRHCHHPPKGR